MKLKVLARNPDDYLRETKKDIHKVPRNYDPALHPFEAPREYTRALNAVKLERVFAKPLLGALEGHQDGVHCLCKHPTSLSLLLSGSCDGQVKMWDLAKRECVRTVSAHDGFVRGMCFNPNGEYFFTCGDDKVIKQWSMDGGGEDGEATMNTILSKQVLQGMDHHWRDDVYATCGQTVDIWDETRAEPVRTFSWGVDSIHNVKFNPIETTVLGATASDRSVLLYDMRGSTPLRKVILKMRSNTIAWNPMEAFVFTAANEDYNLYTFDMRNLSMPLNIHMDHVSAVLDVDYSPTGREFVSASFDKTLRIFPTSQGHSREVYHTKRMQRVQCVRWSKDDKYIVSGSDEMNLRLWKARASDKLGVLKPREKEALNYSSKLKEKFGSHPQVKRISRHRHVPRSIHNQAKELRTIRQSQKRKEANKRRHHKAGAVPFVAQRKKVVVGEME